MENLPAAGSLLMKVFGVVAGKGPKRVGALYVTYQLFKTYFKLGTVNLCPSVIRSIETARIFDFEEFPRRDKADSKLSYALQYCNPKRERNIIYISLNPNSLRVQYKKIVQALRKGDLRLLRHALQEHEDLTVLI